MLSHRNLTEAELFVLLVKTLEEKEVLEAQLRASEAKRRALSTRVTYLERQAKALRGAGLSLITSAFAHAVKKGHERPTNLTTTVFVDVRNDDAKKEKSQPTRYSVPQWMNAFAMLRCALAKKEGVSVCM